MKKIPYIETGIQKVLDKVKSGDVITLATHSGNFHADDVCATGVLKLFFKLLDPNIKLKIIRTTDQKKLDAATIVYDIGKIYDAKKLRFDHHQPEGAGARENGTKHAAIGLVWKHFGVSYCALSQKGNTGKLPSKVEAVRVAEIIEQRFISHIDAMDNGQITFETIFEDTIPLTIDNLFEMCKGTVATTGISTTEVNKNFDTMFKFCVEMIYGILEIIRVYATTKVKNEKKGLFAYKKAKDKRIIVSDIFIPFNFGKMPEPLVTVYPDTRGGWSAKNVRKDEAIYEAKFHFPESWRGKSDEELEKETGVKGAKFCHNSGFLVVADTKEHVLALVKLAFELEGIK